MKENFIQKFAESSKLIEGIKKDLGKKAKKSIVRRIVHEKRL